ncbi:MAG TPA: MbnP family protein [Chitinophagales bacterium]|nr:MbnP family protein [Chitinophagales bacterium]
MSRITLLFIFLLLLTACKKDDVVNDPISSTIQIATYSNGEKVNDNQAISLYDGISYKITSLKYYISNVRLVNAQGQETPFVMDEKILGSEQGVFLYELGENEKFEGVIPAAQYVKIRFDLGLDTELNNLDPNQFSAKHPLSRDTDMFWDMMKYRFVIMEADADTSKVDLYNFPFSFHLGGNEFLRHVELDINWNVKSNSTSTLPIRFDLDKVFTDGTEQIDILKFFSYHSAPGQKEIGLKLMDNISKSFE